MHPERNKTQQTTLKHGEAWTFLIWHTQTLCAVGTEWPLSGPSWTEQSHFEGQDPIVREAQIAETAGLKTLADLSLISLRWDSDFFLSSVQMPHTFPVIQKLCIVSLIQHNHLSNFATHRKSMSFPNFPDLRYDIRFLKYQVKRNIGICVKFNANFNFG